MRHGSLFSGIGGFDLASEWMGWENVFHCEWDSFCQKVLKYYWPKSESYGDITKTDFTIWRGRIDILTGGFPCQPYSQAGKRLGKEDDRHLWPEMLRAIREIQPRWVVGENVHGIVNWSGGLVFEEVQTDLENEGYEVQPYILPAASVNAPHRRDRVFFVARRTPADTGCITEGRKVKPKWEANDPSGCCSIKDTRGEGNSDESRTPPDTDLERWEECNIPREPEAQIISDRGVNVADTESERHESFDKDRTAIFSASAEEGLHGRGSHKYEPKRTPPDTDSERGCSRDGKRQNAEYVNSRSQAFRHRGYFEGFPTQRPVCGRNDGIPSQLDGLTFPKWRNESIKAMGNAVVVPLVYEIFRAIDSYEHLLQK
jgi:DNA (cytosine-5)-methyltransferase 1